MALSKPSSETHSTEHGLRKRLDPFCKSCLSLLSLGMSMLESEEYLKSGLACVYVCVSVYMFVHTAIGPNICSAKCHSLPVVVFYTLTVIFSIFPFIFDSLLVVVVAMAAVGTTLLARILLFLLCWNFMLNSSQPPIYPAWHLSK